MSNVLKIKIAGQRVKYETARVTFNEDDLQKAKSWRWDYKGNRLFLNDNKLDILKDYETFDCAVAGVAIRNTGDIYYELGNEKGNIITSYVRCVPNHPILVAIEDAHNEDCMTLTTANLYDEKNAIYEYTIEVSDNELFDVSLLEIITINDPITNKEYIVDVWYDYKKMQGGIDGLPFRGEPVSKNSLLTVPKDYAVALGLGENRRLDNILRFEDFIKEENSKVRKKPTNKVKSVKDYVKIREDYIHSFIDEHERDQELPEEE